MYLHPLLGAVFCNKFPIKSWKLKKSQKGPLLYLKRFYDKQ